MIIKVWRVLRVPTLRETRVIVFTVLVPVSPFIATVFSCSVIWGSLMYVVWCLGAWLLIGSMLKEQKEGAEQTVDAAIDEVSGRLQQLRDGHSGRITGLQDQIDELDRVMRAAFEGIGYPLPPRRIPVRANFVGVGGSLSAAVGVAGGSRMAHIRRWVRSKAQWVKRWVKRIVWDWDKAA